MKFIFKGYAIAVLLKLLFSCSAEPYLEISSHPDGINIDFNNEESYFYKLEWKSQFVMEINRDYRLTSNTLEFPIYMICQNGAIKKVSKNDTLERGCILSASKTDDEFHSTYHRAYQKYFSLGSVILDNIFEDKRKSIVPSMSEYDVLVYWTKIIHDHLNYSGSWNPVALGRSLDEILLSGDGDCEDFVMAVNYLLMKSGIKAHPVAVTANLRRVLNVWSGQLRYDHLAIRLVETGIIADVTDKSLIAKTHLLLTGFPAFDLVEEKEYVIPSVETFELNVNSEKYEVFYSVYGADESLYELANVVLRKRNLQPYYEEVYKDYNIKNYTNSAQIEPYYTTVSISFDLDKKDNKNNAYDLPLKVGFAPIIETYDTERGISCYFGSDRIIRLNTPKLKLLDQSLLVRKMENGNVKWESYFSDTGLLNIELTRLSKDGCNFTRNEPTSEKVIRGLNNYFSEIGLDI